MVTDALRAVLAHRPGAVALAFSALAASLVGLYLVAVRTRGGQVVDETVLWTLAVPGPPSEVVEHVRSASALAAAGTALLAAVRAVRDGRPRALLVLVTPVLAWFVAVVLRDVLLDRPELGVGGYAFGTLPSAHTTFTAAAALASATLLGPRLTGVRAAALTMLVAVAMWANVATMAHRPSDVLAGLAVAALAWLFIDTTTSPRGRQPHGRGGVRPG